jgi:photosystem II stability/assembly factor-like uncharacterized protein
LFLIVAAVPAGAEPLFEIHHLFTKQRTPKIIVAQDGSVLAFAKSCKLLRRSTDGGATWSETVNVPIEGGGNAMINDTTGEVLIVMSGKGMLCRSRDHGATWEKQLTPSALCRRK